MTPTIAKRSVGAKKEFGDIVGVTYITPKRYIVSVFDDFQKAGAVYKDKHFVYYSGKHGPHYINTDVVFPDVAQMRKIAWMLAEPFIGQFDIVVGPPTGGIVLATYTVNVLAEHGHQATLLWTDWDDDDFVFKRAGFAEKLQGKRVLVVEDIVTTGASAAKVCQQIERNNGSVVAISAICNRGGVTSEKVGWPFQTLTSIDFDDYDPDDCPLCKQQIPIVVNIGHGSDFQKTNPDYAGTFVRM